MMMGTAGELPKPPPKPVQFLEDMTDAEVAEAVRSTTHTLDNPINALFDSWIFLLDWKTLEIHVTW